MPSTYSYPGVYIEEIPSGVRTISGVATSITAFIGRALRGPVNEPVRIQNYGEYERNFGGLWANSTMSYAVQQYFLNGGADAIIVRVVNSATAAVLRLAPSTGPLELTAADPGAWGNTLRAVVDHNTKDTLDSNLFNLTIDALDVNDEVVRSEVFRNVSIDSTSPRYVDQVLAQDSTLVNVSLSATEQPDEGSTTVLEADEGSDGSAVGATQISSGNGLETNKQGIWALEKSDLFNLFNIPPFDRSTDVASNTLSSALAYCKKRRAMLLVDAPMAWNSAADALNSSSGIDSVLARDANAAIFFPYLRSPDPLQENRLGDFAPSGAIAGVFARIDSSRGVWKAPAGIEANLRGVSELGVKLTDGENGQLNPLGINCLRSFPIIGRVVWGARTLAGADILASEWKYVPVRRLALNIEESLYRGSQWVVFEPNDEPLWAQIRLNVGAYMHNLFRQGAFQGISPKQAYFVKCDKETTTQNDINLGIVNIVVGFAPLKPAEFVVIKLQQIAGQVEA